MIPMNFRNALGFFAVGAVLAVIPRFAGGASLSAGIDAMSASTLWLQFMSFVLMGLGVAYFAQRSLVGLASLLEYTPQTAYRPATQTRTAMPVARPLTPVPALSPIRAALIDQRRAA
jgi:hypothetical protein